MGIHDTVQIQKQYSDPVHVPLTTLEPMEFNRGWGEGAERGPLVLTSLILIAPCQWGRALRSPCNVKVQQAALRGWPLGLLEVCLFPEVTHIGRRH